MPQPRIKMDGKTFKGFSRKHFKGCALVTYIVEDTTNLVYVEWSMPINNILAFIRHEWKGLEHLIGSVHKWSPSAFSIIEP